MGPKRLRPRAGDWVDFVIPSDQKEMGSSFRTGHVVKREGNEFVVRPTGTTSTFRIPLELMRGWWPKLTTSRSPDSRREIET